MKTLFFTIGTEVVASSRTRVYQFIPYLKRKGIECKVISYLSKRRCRDDIFMKKLNILKKVVDKSFSWLKTLKFLFLVPNYDVVLVQRVLLPIFVQKILKGLNRNIIYDFDDALQLFGKRFLPRFINILRGSRVVIVENDFNKRFVLKYNSNVEILTGPIDVHRYRPKGKDNRALDGEVSLGWIGSPSTSEYLEMLKDVFRTLKEKYKQKIIIKFIGSGKLNWNTFDYQSVEWNLETEVEELQSFDIGIMPLEDDEWCRGKGGYKLLQYMAVGIPCVASPVGVNREIVEDKVTGFLTSTPQEWMQKLSLLIEDRTLRLQMGAKGKEKVERCYSYKVNSPILISIFKNLLKE